MSKERELLIGAVEWMHELKYVWANVRDSGDYDLLELIADINNIELLLAQPEQTEQEPVEDRIARWHKLGYEQGKKASKREPLSDDAIWDGIPAQGVSDHKAMTFVQGIKWAEQMHGIGGEE